MVPMACRTIGVGRGLGPFLAPSFPGITAAYGSTTKPVRAPWAQSMELLSLPRFVSRGPLNPEEEAKLFAVRVKRVHRRSAE